VRLRIRPDAAFDIEEAHQWYEKKRRGLGADFLVCVEATLERIRRSPESYPRVHLDLRRAVVRRFPYGVFYVIEVDEIVVVGLFHVRRNPTN
jgi:hypothetical protein